MPSPDPARPARESTATIRSQGRQDPDGPSSA